MYTVFVHIRIRPGVEAAFLAACQDNHRNTRLEPGNLRFDVLRANDDPLKFFLYEVYLDEAAFKAHQQTAHYFRWRDGVADLMAEPRRADKATSILPDPWQ